MPAGQAEAAGHLLEAHLAAVLVRPGRGELAARHAHAARRLDRPLRAGAAHRRGPRPPLGLPVRVEHGALRADRAVGDEAVVAAELRHAHSEFRRSPLPAWGRCGPPSSRTCISAAWPARTSRGRSKPLAALVEAVSDADRLVLLGDIVELRERPLAEALEVSRPVLEALGRAMAGRPVVLVPGQPRPRARRAVARAAAARGRGAAGGGGVAGGAGRRRGRAHRRVDARRGADARLSRPAAARRRLRHSRPLPRPAPDHPAARVDRGVRDGPAHEARPRARARPPTTRPSSPRCTPSTPASPRAPRPARWPAAAASRAPSGSAPATAARPTPPRPSAPATRRARASAAATRFLLGRVTIPGAVAALNVLGLGPFRATLTGEELRRSGLDAMARVAEVLAPGTPHVVFGHTHRPGPLRARRPGRVDDALGHAAVEQRELAARGRVPPHRPRQPLLAGHGPNPGRRRPAASGTSWPVRCRSAPLRRRCAARAQRVRGGVEPAQLPPERPGVGGPQRRVVAVPVDVVARAAAGDPHGALGHPVELGVVGRLRLLAHLERVRRRGRAASAARRARTRPATRS